ncbi:MAG: ribonuclease HII [Anaerolineales bacterium]|nr:ribonuclease HII [Anaerolineales bacterium]
MSGRSSPVSINQLTADLIRNHTVTRLSSIIRDRDENLSSETLSRLEEDPRAGVRALASRARRKLQAASLEQTRLKSLCGYEQELWNRGLTRIAGRDEAGVGPLAGPVVAAAVFFPPGLTIPGVNDSKKLSSRRREELAQTIKEKAVSWATGQASPLEIDEINIYQAGLLAMQRALEKLLTLPEYLLIDARRLQKISLPQKAIIKGDSKSFTIAAASILAKTCRDNLMLEMDKKYPGYGFLKHKGYPTLAHREALRLLGPCPEHRRSFSLL